MVNRQNALQKRDYHTQPAPKPSPGGAPSHPWRQWYSSAQGPDSLPLEVAQPSNP